MIRVRRGFIHGCLSVPEPETAVRRDGTDLAGLLTDQNTLLPYSEFVHMLAPKLSLRRGFAGCQERRAIFKGAKLLRAA